MFRQILSLAAVFSLVLTTSAASAATLTVHSAGPFTSVNAALTAANPGDIIEITDNSTTFSENLYITKNNITIRGQVGLTPKPKIQGIKQAHPLPNSTAAPQKWWWIAPDVNTNYTIFDTYGATVVNAASGLTLRNLQIECEPTSSTTGTSTTGLLDFRFGSGGLVEDCYLNASGINASGVEVAGAEKGCLTANDHTFRNCTFYRGNVTLEHQGGPGTLRIEDCLVTGPVHSLYFYGGDAVVEDTEIVYNRVSGAARATEVGNVFGHVNVLFKGSSIRKLTSGSTADNLVTLRQDDRGTAFGADNYGTGRFSTGTIELEFDNCDLIGGPGVAVTRVVETAPSDRVNWNLKKLKFTDCNFYRIAGNIYSSGSSIPYKGNEYMGPGVATLFEDYNVFKLCLNTAEFAGLTQGGHSITLDQGQPLYVDVANGNYQLASNSPAATLNSTGAPVFTGSKGVSGTSVPNAVITVGHSGGTYTSIQTALSAAQDGDCIQIVDNSAPYVAAIDLATSMGVTLQGAPNLNPRPTIKGNGTQKPFLFNSTVHNMSLRNLILDSSNTSGTNSTVFENQRPGVVTALTSVTLAAGPSTLYNVVQDQCSLILTNCDMTIANAARPGILKRRAGVCALINSSVVSAGNTVELFTGKLLLHNSRLQSSASNVVQMIHNATYAGTSMVELHDSLIRSTAATGTNALVRINTTANRRSILFDNCDFIGSSANVTPSAVDVQSTLTHARVVDSIFTNLSTAAYTLGIYTQPSTIPGLTFNPLANWENYNVYQNAPNTLDTVGGVEGANNLNLGNLDPLYTDPSLNDFRLRPSSLAATLNSTGTPVYAGSQGIGTEPANTAAQPDWALYQ